jgi:hypothetical protein
VPFSLPLPFRRSAGAAPASSPLRRSSPAPNAGSWERRAAPGVARPPPESAVPSVSPNPTSPEDAPNHPWSPRAALVPLPLPFRRSAGAAPASSPLRRSSPAPNAGSWERRAAPGVARPPPESAVPSVSPDPTSSENAPNHPRSPRAALVPLPLPFRRAPLPQAAGALTNPAPEPARGSGVTAPVRGAAAVAVDASARTAPPITERPERCMISASRVVGAVRSLDTDDASPLPRAGRGARDS